MSLFWRNKISKAINFPNWGVLGVGTKIWTDNFILFIHSTFDENHSLDTLLLCFRPVLQVPSVLGHVQQSVPGVRSMQASHTRANVHRSGVGRHIPGYILLLSTKGLFVKKHYSNFLTKHVFYIHVVCWHFLAKSRERQGNNLVNWVQRHQQNLSVQYGIDPLIVHKIDRAFQLNLSANC